MYRRQRFKVELRLPRGVHSEQVLLDAWRGLITELEAGLEEDGGELGVRLRGEPKTEVLMGLQLLEFLFQRGKPRRDEVQILEAHPQSLGGCLSEHLQRHLVLVTTHGHLLEVLSSYFRSSELLQLFAGV